MTFCAQKASTMLWRRVDAAAQTQSIPEAIICAA
jgi:hypothetical protein